MNTLTEKSGFTLIETMMAIVILSIGIMALYAMQTSAIKGNAVAISLTTATNLGQDIIEQVLSRPYIDPPEFMLRDTDGNGCGGLDDRPVPLPAGTGDGGSDHSFTSANDLDYTVYWNVANNCSLTAIPNALVPADEQKLKHVRFFVVRTDMGIQKTVEFNYIMQNSM